MNYCIYCNEKALPAAHKDAMGEYIKRLSAYCKVQLITGKFKQSSNSISSGNHQVILLSKDVSTYSSEEFAKEIQQLETCGKSNIHIFIGYDNCFLKQYFQKKEITIQTMAISNSSLSYSTLCVLFAEQLYRGYTILQGKTYHK